MLLLRIWSLYEYWPVAESAVATSEWMPCDHKVTELEKIIKNFGSAFDIELVHKHTRRLNYPMVSHDGQVYTHSPKSMYTYQSLGSVFSDEVLVKAYNFCAPQKTEANIRHGRRIA